VTVVIRDLVIMKDLVPVTVVVRDLVIRKNWVPTFEEEEEGEGERNKGRRTVSHLTVVDRVKPPKRWLYPSV
jgi:hypothetical protein